MMKKQLSNLQKQDLLHAILMLVIGVLAYLLLIKRMGLYGDDWYFMFDAHTQGPEFFKVIFYSDRPAGAYLMNILYKIFGDHLILYHLYAFMCSYIGALAFYWTLNVVWEQNKFPNFLMALLFLVYPGFLNQVQPVIYQSNICGLSLAMISIALTVRVVKIKSSIFVKIALVAISILTGLYYLALVEYFIGIEFLRLYFIACIVWWEWGGTIKQRIARILWGWLPFSIIPIGFLVWRVLIFKSARPATDIGLQLGVFFASPLHVGLLWLENALYGTFNTIYSAWIVPFYNIVIMGGFSLGDTLLVIAIGIVALIIFFLGLWAGRLFSQSEWDGSNWIRQALWGGLAAALVGVIPVIISNRTVDFNFSRYTMAGSPGGIIMIVAGISLLKSRRVQAGAAGLLVLLSVMTHFGNALNHVYQADSLRDFWWQVSWRAPTIEAGTNLVASYSLMEIQEDYVIWGPANLIYYPEKQDASQVKIQLPASILSGETILNVISHGDGRDRYRRGNYVHEDFSALLVLTQPTIGSCVRIIDGSKPELSPLDSYGIMLIAPYSLIGNVNMAATTPTLPVDFFGTEPVHGWCYYYEKAELASQMGDWAYVIALGEEAAAKGFRPNDPVEWSPFLRAYVATGQMDSLRPYQAIMNETSFIQNQTCQILKLTANETRPGDLEIMTSIENDFCRLP
jgi:hypothetical protein